VPVAKLAAKTLVGEPLRELLAPYWPYPTRNGGGGALDAHLDAAHRAPTPWPARVAVKEVVLPFGRFPGVDVLRGPEMRSTGEVMSFGENFPTAYAKAQIAAGNPLPETGTVLISLADSDKREGTLLAAQLHDLGFELAATEGTARVLRGMGVPVREVHKVGEGRPDVVDLIAGGDVQLVVNTPSLGDNGGVPVAQRMEPENGERRALPLPLPDRRTVGYRIRTAALAHHVPYVTTLVVLRAVVVAIRSQREGALSVAPLEG
jgi:carbamoyl-phosphate synthase large subunit